MLRDAAVELIKARMLRTGTTATDATIVTEMQLVQEATLEGHHTLPWFTWQDTLQEAVTLVTAAGQSYVTLPVNFLREIDEGGIWRYDSTVLKWIRLVKEDMEYLIDTVEQSEQAVPTHYSIINERLQLFHTPDAEYSLRAVWAVKDVVLSSNIENKWLKYAPDLVIAETGVVIARDVLRDTVAAETFMSMAQRAWDRLWRNHEGHLHANRTYSMGD